MARILVIDDDASLLQMMSIMLKRAGHEAILANSGQEGIQIARSDRPDVAIVDVMMPDLSGYEVCRILREDPQTVDIPLLILTALAQPEQRARAEDAGADQFVTKPVTRDDLVNAVTHLLETGAQNMPAPDYYTDETQPSEAYAQDEDLQGFRMPPSGRLEDAGPGPSAEDPISAAFSQPAPPQPPAPPPPAAPAPVPQRPARPAAPGVQAGDLPLIAVMGLARSVGTTTVAVNLSLGVMQFGRSVILDFNPQGGQVALQLRMIPPRSTWVDLVGVQPGMDKRQIGGALLLGHQSGVAVLASPMNPTSEHLAGDGMIYVLQVLSEGFKRIVVDLPSTLNAMSLATLRRARHVVLVLNDDPATLLTVPSTLATIQELGLPGNVHIVLNRVRGQTLQHEDVVRRINRPLSADVPHDPAQPLALTQGIPLVMAQPNSLFAQTILHLARQL